MRRADIKGVMLSLKKNLIVFISLPLFAACSAGGLGSQFFGIPQNFANTNQTDEDTLNPLSDEINSAGVNVDNFNGYQPDPSGSVDEIPLSDDSVPIDRPDNQSVGASNHFQNGATNKNSRDEDEFPTDPSYGNDMVHLPPTPSKGDPTIAASDPTDPGDCTPEQEGATIETFSNINEDLAGALRSLGKKSAHLQFKTSALIEYNGLNSPLKFAEQDNDDAPDGAPDEDSDVTTYKCTIDENGQAQWTAEKIETLKSADFNNLFVALDNGDDEDVRANLEYLTESSGKISDIIFEVKPLDSGMTTKKHKTQITIKKGPPTPPSNELEQKLEPAIRIVPIVINK
jgi:hypothetical protein